mmetsp:Transcript_19681/g.35605  ORF Transcript_19681/g.35605 Transcript_19681/m.35605 type:complete len:401 (-) Transcript_19681:4-1206(-)
MKICVSMLRERVMQSHSRARTSCFELYPSQFSFQLIIAQNLRPLLRCQINLRLLLVIIVLIITLLGIYSLRWTPNLQHIILAHASQTPIVIRIPRKIIDFGSMASVQKQQFRRSVLGILGRLFHANAGEIPEGDAAIGRAGCQDGFVEGGPVDGVDLVRVPFERLEWALQIPHIPQLDNLIRPATRQQKLIGGMKLQTVDIPIMRLLDHMYRLVAFPLPHIPQTNELIVSTASNHVGIAIVPIDILDHIGMILQRRLGMDDRAILAILQCLFDIPETHRLILRTRDQPSLILLAGDAAPRQSVPLPAVSPANHLRIRRDGLLAREAGMFAQVPNVNFRRRAAGGYHEVILGHVSRAIDLAVVEDFHFDVDFSYAVDGGVAAQFVFFFVVVCGGVGGGGDG